MHGGISLQSEKGKGSTFSLTVATRRIHEYPPPPGPTTLAPSSSLTLVRSPSSRARQISGGCDGSGGGETCGLFGANMNVLVVEDNLLNQQVISRVLKIKGLCY
jgi:hypothetical protein